MSYKPFKKGEKAAYYAVTKEKIRGRHIATPYRSRPQVGQNHVVVSGKDVNYSINENGYAVTKKLPTKTITKRRNPRRRQQPNIFGPWF